MDFPRLLRHGERAKRHENGAKNNESECFRHFFCLSLRLSLVTRSFLLDHSIRPVEHRLWDRQVERFSRLKIDCKLKLRGLLHRKIGGLRAFQNFVYVPCRPSVTLSSVSCIGHESTCLYVTASFVH